jgi:SAM-dependent methyltransferase
MHASVMEWVEQKVRQHALVSPQHDVLEVGSRDINGTVRRLFQGVRQYTGIDAIGGPGVDRVLDAHRLGEAFPENQFDVVVSTEMLEHDSAFWRSVEQMGRVLRPGGFMLLTARGNGFWIHDYPHDYWRFLPDSFRQLFELAGCDSIEIIEDWHPGHPGVFGLGRKRI